VGRGWPFRCLARWRRGRVRGLRESSFRTRERCETAARDRWKKDCVPDKSCLIVLLPLTANQVFWPICQGYQSHRASRDRHFVSHSSVIATKPLHVLLSGIWYNLLAISSGGCCPPPSSSASIICVYPTGSFVKTCSPANLTSTGPGNRGMLRGRELRRGVCSGSEFRLLRWRHRRLRATESFLLAHTYK
jgi:hypothetical protein